MTSRAEEAKTKAFSLLEKRDYSRGEMVSKLREKGFEEEDAAAAADRLCELGVIDDAKYAAMVVRHYAGKGYGVSRVKQELFRRRIPRELYDEALEEMPEQDGAVDELLRAKLRGREADRDSVRRAADALFRRGFSWDEINAAVERYNSERES